MEQGIVLKEDERYPALLKGIPTAPKLLYYRGTWDGSLFDACLAVVGTRRITSYGKRVVEQMVGEIAAAGITIVSGFMYGVDAAAHKTAIQAGGKTIAVMPCGINLVHPGYQKKLHQEIIESGGLILSEYEGDFLPTNWSYPQRNRIVAGLSQATLVVEAGEKSGSLITANFARKFKHALFAVPGPITSSVSQGTLQLLQEGAILGKSAQTILSFYKEAVPSFQQKSRTPIHHQQGERSGSSVESRILEVLQREPMGIDMLARYLNMSAANLGTTLSFMQLNRRITEEGGIYYIE